MRKFARSEVFVSNKTVTKIDERLKNTGIRTLEKNPNLLTNDILAVLNKYNLIDKEDDEITIQIEIRS